MQTVMSGLPAMERGVLLGVAGLLLLRIPFVTIETAGSYSNRQYEQERRKRRRAAWMYGVLGIGLVAGLAAASASAPSSSWYFYAFVVLAAASGYFFGKKYATTRGIAFLSDAARRGFSFGSGRAAFTYDMGPADVILAALAVLIGILARGGISSTRLIIAWVVLIAAAAIGVSWYARMRHNLWAKELQIGSYESLWRIDPDYRSSAGSGSERTSKFSLPPFVIRITDEILLLAAFIGLPLWLAFSIPTTWSRAAAAAAIAAYVIPLVFFRIKAIAVMKRGAHAFASLVNAVSSNDPKGMAAALASSPQIETHASKGVEVLFKRSKTAFDDTVAVFADGHGHEALIKPVWDEGFVRVSGRIDGDERAQRLVRFTNILREKRCPARQRGVLLGYMLREMDGGAQSAFFRANPEVFGDEELMHHLDVAHGMRLAKS